MIISSTVTSAGGTRQFLGCDMLDENAHKVINEEARFRLLRFATLYSKPIGNTQRDRPYFWAQQPHNAHFLWPESKIPWWFSHKSEESSISINLSHPDQWYNNSYLGLATCVILEFKDIISLWRDYVDLYLYCDIVYMFPNGNSWRRKRSTRLFIPYLKYIPWFCDCCNGIGEVTMNLDDHIQHHRHPMTNCQHVFMFVYAAYGNVLAFKDTQIDAYGIMNKRNPHEYPGEYVKADQGSSDWGRFLALDCGQIDANGNMNNWNILVESNQESESRGREVIYFEPNQEGEEPLPKRIRV